jgi:predicted hotdog family 3-hydroxylacyl-ACP dehydratase
MPLTKTEICELLPHTGSMCLLEAVQHWDQDEILCVAESHRDPSNPLRRRDILPAVSGVEYAAQAMGVHGGLVSRLAVSKPTVGYLASLRDVALRVTRLDNIAAPLLVRVRRVADTVGSVMCDFELSADGGTLVSGRATLLMMVGAAG